jgi:Fe-S cluster assembly protein SufD
MSTTLVSDAIEPYAVAFERLRGELPGGGRVAELRRGAMQAFSEIGFPDVRQEEWRFTDVSPIAGTDFDLLPGTANPDAAALEPYSYEGCYRMVLVNGRLAPELSDLAGLPEGVEIRGLAAALADGSQSVAADLGRHAAYAEHPFVALNTALWRDGVLVRVPRGVALDKPVNLVVLGTPGERPIAFFPRILVIAEESSQLTLVEQYATLGEGRYLSCPVTEIVAQPNSVVDHYKLQRESNTAFHVATFQIHQDRDSNVSSHSISWGGALVRNDVNAILAGEGCDANLNGLYLVEGDQLVDYHMRVEHAAPHCDSHELFKGILEGSARSVFNGRIYVHPGAQKTDAKQTSRNLLLSPDALCNANPQLEIFADDVKCTHGSTVGQLDDTAIFYLRSRGIGEEAARSLLTYAFAADIVERIRVPQVRQELEEFLFRRLPKGDIVRQAV